jgi:tRNA A37 threonylcarbamoyladenosine synthetase subunit TsaC/SUA5/YrdC
MDETLTSDPRDPAQTAAEAARVHDSLLAGGVAIIPLDVAYAVVGATEAAIRAIFAAKGRSWSKPSGLFGSLAWSEALHILPEERRVVARALVAAGLPFSIVAPFRADHPALAGTEPFVIERSSKDGTLDMLINAGALHDSLAAISLARARPVFGSSANRSLTGSRYRLAEVEAEVRAAAAVELDHGRSRYANPAGLSSTILDFRDFAVLRRGVCFEAIAALLAEQFGVTLEPPPPA